MSEDTPQELLLEIQDRIATITLNRPARRNALTPTIVTGLTQHLIELSERDDVGVIVITGAGDKAFCAGADLLNQQAAEGALAMHHDRGAFAQLLIQMHRCARPIIAKVNGHALGGGFGLALNCDLVVASEAATFGTPEIKVGLFPMMIMAVIAKNLGRKRAMELMLTAERVSGPDAVTMGIANACVPADKLDEHVHALATRVAGFSPAVLRLGRQAFYKTQDMSFEQALGTLQNELTINTLAEDAAEGIMAFFSNQPPQWKGR